MTDTTERRDLLTVVDDLTLPTNLRATQDVLAPLIDPQTKLQSVDDDGNLRWVKTGTRRVPVTADPLLQQLQDAITASMGGPAGKGGLAHERIPLDADALYRAVRITSRITEWCVMYGIRPTRNPITDLRAWYARTRSDNTFAEAFYLDEVSGWAREVRNLLNRWDEHELPDPCPRCGASEWREPDDPLMHRGRPVPGRKHPLLLKFRRTDGPNMIERAWVYCRACDPEAQNTWGAREVKFEIEALSADTQEGTTAA